MKTANSLLACAATFGVVAFGFFSLYPLGATASKAEAAPSPVAAITTSTAEGFGTIKGRLVWGGNTAPEPKPVAPAPSGEFCAGKTLFDNGLKVDPKTKGIANAFAYVIDPKGKNPEAEKALLAKEPTVVIDNKNCEFVPYSTAIFKGQQLVFKNDDPVSHNTHLSSVLDPSNNSNAMLPPKTKLDAKIKPEKQVIPLKCDIHPWMNGYVMAFDHPFFAVSKEDGSFEITGVPAGTQNLIVRNGAVGYVTPNGKKGLTVVVKAGETTDVGDIKLDPTKVK